MLTLSRRERGDRADSARSFEHFLGRPRFPALDGLRGVAALMVIAYHYGGPEYRWLSGWTGIQIFFVLSGFLITTLSLREESSAGRISLRNFWTRRAFRILPVYVVVLLAMILTTYRRGGSDWSLLQEALPHYVTFTNEFGHPESPWMLSWTLGIEQKFYLLWPLIAFGVALSAQVRLLTIGMAAGALTLAAAFWADVPGSPASYVSILFGCALAVAMHTRTGFDRLMPLMSPTGRIVVPIVFLAAQLLVADSYDRVGELAAVAYVVVVAALLPGLVTGGAPAAALSTRLLRWLGARSYSLYLSQVLAAWTVYALLPDLGRTAMVIATMAVGLVAADFLYRYVEAPMIHLGRRIENPGRPARTRYASTTASGSATATSQVIRKNAERSSTPST